MFASKSLKSVKKSLVVAGALMGLFASSAQAITGTVSYYFTQDYTGSSVYTFVNINSGSAICYYVGINTAYASIFATTQNAGGTVTVNCDSSGKITQVAN